MKYTTITFNDMAKKVPELSSLTYTDVVQGVDQSLEMMCPYIKKKKLKFICWAFVSGQVVYTFKQL